MPVAAFDRGGVAHGAVCAHHGARRRLLPHRASGAKTWYTAGVDLARQRPYLITLLRSQEMFEAGTLLQVRHLQSTKYYTRKLAGKCNGVLGVENPQPLPAIPLEADATNGDVPLHVDPLPAPELSGTDVLQRSFLNGSMTNVC